MCVCASVCVQCSCRLFDGQFLIDPSYVVNMFPYPSISMPVKCYRYTFSCYSNKAVCVYVLRMRFFSFLFACLQLIYMGFLMWLQTLQHISNWWLRSNWFRLEFSIQVQTHTNTQLKFKHIRSTSDHLKVNSFILIRHMYSNKMHLSKTENIPNKTIRRKRNT